MSGQSIMDRMTAAKHSLSGQGLAKVVCKATTEEVMGPKKKHLDCKYDQANSYYYIAEISRTTLKPSPLMNGELPPLVQHRFVCSVWYWIHMCIK